MMFHNFRHRKIQIGIIFLIVTLTVVLLNGAVCILKSLEDPMTEFAKECNSPQIQAYPYFEDGKKLKECVNNLEQLPDVTKAEEVHMIYLANGITSGTKNITAYCGLGEYKEDIYKNVRVIAGTMEVSSYSDSECAIPACVSNEYDVALGDTIKTTIENKEYTYRVAGIYSDIYDMSTAFDSRILVKKLPEVTNRGALVYLYTNDVPASRIVEEYQEAYGDLYMNMTPLKEQMDNSMVSAHIVGGVFLSIGIIMLFVSIVIIFFIVNNTMLSDAKKIAIYKTMGYTYRDIVGMYLKFYAILVGSGALLGIFGSRVWADSILNQIFLNMGMKAHVSLLFPGVFTFLATTILVLGMIYLVLKKTRQVRPVFILSGLSSRNSKKAKEYKGNLTIAFSPAGLALRNFLRNKRGALGILLTSIVTIFAINFAVISIDIAYSMEKENTFWFAFDSCDFIIAVDGREALEEAKDALKQNKDVDFYSQNTVNDQQKVMLEYQKGLTNRVIYPFVYESYQGLDLPLVEGRNPENENEIAVATVLAEQLNKSIGDYIRISLDASTKVDFLITGTFQTYANMGQTARLLGSVYSSNQVDFSYNTLSVYVKKSADRDDVIRALKEKVRKTDTFKYREDCFESIMNMIAEPQKAGIPPVMALVLVISAINIFSIVLLKNARTKKRNQIYKSIGYSTGELIYSNLFYVGVIACIAIAVAVPLTILSYPRILTGALSVFALKKYPVEMNCLHLAAGNLAVIALFIVSTLLSSRSLSKVSVRELVIE